MTFELFEGAPYSAYVTGKQVRDGTIGKDDLTPEVQAALAQADAAAVSFTPTGTIAATNVQAAIEEVAAETWAAIRSPKLGLDPL